MYYNIGFSYKNIRWLRNNIYLIFFIDNIKKIM